jgi:DNA-binding Lrp family transcriptional regulator
MEKPDAIDWEILRTISHDGRMPVSRIARKLGIKRETVKYRLNKLFSSGVIKYCLPYLDLAKIGYPVWGFMLVSFKDLDSKSEAQFDDYVRKNPHIIFAYRSLGEWDFGVEFFAKTPQHLYEIQKELKSKFAKIIKDVKTGSIIEVTKISYVPNFD